MTNRFTLDARGKKVYVGDCVSYNNCTWLLEDIDYLTWNSNQYLTLRDVRNKNKKINFVLSGDVIGVK